MRQGQSQGLQQLQLSFCEADLILRGRLEVFLRVLLTLLLPNRRNIELRPTAPGAHCPRDGMSLPARDCGPPRTS